MRVLVPLAEGFEEIEAIVPIDVLRRAGVNVCTAAVGEKREVKASRETRHLADVILEEVLKNSFDLIYLPGGRPGADHLRDHLGLIKKLQQHHEEGKWIAAICAAPLVLDRAGILKDKKFTCHPSAQNEIQSGNYGDEILVRDGNIVTGKAAGNAYEMSFALVEVLCGKEKVEEVNKGMFWQGK